MIGTLRRPVFAPGARWVTHSRRHPECEVRLLAVTDHTVTVEPVRSRVGRARWSRATRSRRYCLALARFLRDYRPL